MARVNHVAILVADLDAAMELFSDVWGIAPADIVTLEHQGIRTAAYDFDNLTIELMEPYGEESVVRRSLEKRGPQIHHIAVEVRSARDRMQELKAKGLVFTTEEPTKGMYDSLVCFLHPKSTFGILTELVQPAEGH